MPSNKYTSLLIYLLFGVAVTFMVIMLLQWINFEMANPIHMGLFIGVFLAFIFWVLYERGRRSNE